MTFRAGPPRVRLWRLALPAAAIALTGNVVASAPAQASSTAPMVSAVSTSSDSWVTFPMGDLSDPDNTFWELFHATPNSPGWSLVTPPGVADNGGLVASASAGAVVVGVVPSGLLRFSPLAESAHGGSSWAPVFLPGALAPLPDALAYAASSPGGAIALLNGDRALSGPAGLTSWSSLVTAAALRRVAPGCGVDELDGATLLPTGAPLIATGCLRGGQVGLFTRTATTWRRLPLTLGGALRGTVTTVVRVQSTAAATTVLVLASRGGRHSLSALWQSGAAPWVVGRSLTLGSGVSIRSTAVNAAGDVAVLLGGRTGSRPVAVEIPPAGQWNQLPRLPHRTVALAMPAGTPIPAGSEVDAFTVVGNALGVFSLTPSGTSWGRIQSSQIPLAYGSSS